jgi:hypothetical protein
LFQLAQVAATAAIGYVRTKNPLPGEARERAKAGVNAAGFSPGGGVVAETAKAARAAGIVGDFKHGAEVSSCRPAAAFVESDCDVANLNDFRF